MKPNRLVVFSIMMVLSITQQAQAGSTLVTTIQSTEDAPQQLIRISKLPHDAIHDHAYLSHSYPESIVEHGPSRGGTIFEWIIPEHIDLNKWLRVAQVQPSASPGSTDDTDEVVTIVDNGPADNRIDLVFMGDGYTENEREKFFDDVKRLTQDMFVGQTFASYLPLFNVHAVFRASQESGIGRNSRPKNTAYRLYREGNTLRAIFPGNKPALRDSCSRAPDCDYPIVIANDPHYGGLGGEFAISTSSITSGTVVLRHELGHNFGRVGEEYDGGGYFGANYSYSSSYVGWRHWLSEKSAKPQQARAKFIDWPWKNLNEGPFSASWRSDGTDSHYEITYSASGVEHDEALMIELDGERLPFTSPGTPDRSFQSIMGHDGGFDSGPHTLTFRRGTTASEPWLSNLAIFEYGDQYNFNDHHVSAYPLFDKNNQVAGFRPTNRTCLMRDMTSVEFCQICQENNWLKFFAKISMIDDLQIDESKELVKVSVLTPPLGDMRVDKTLKKEDVLVTWFHNNEEVKELVNQTSWEDERKFVQGTWRVQVELSTPEVRHDPRRLLKAIRNFQL